MNRLNVIPGQFVIIYNLFFVCLFSRNRKAINLSEYNQFLEKIASNKKIDLDDIKNKLANCGAPATSKTTVS